jgi:hypothetical protein
MGIARVATAGLSCAEAAVAPVLAKPEPAAAPVPVQPASQLAVSCAKAAITLVNVLDKEHHVSLIGAAERKFIGKRVRIVSAWNGRTVARTKVGRSGFFRAHAPTPKNRIRWSNKARYMAVSGDEHSMPLKLHRRMRFSSLQHRGNRVVLTGRVFGLRTHKTITISRRISCTKDVVVKRIHPDRHGRWRAVVKAPKGTRAATYRATTMVRNPGGSKRGFPTFTLPG